MILTLYLCRAVVMIRNFLGRGRVGCCGGCRNPWAISAPFLVLISPPLLGFYIHSLFLFFSFRLLKSFFACRHYIYCFFFTPLFVYSFIHIFSLLTPQSTVPHPTRFQNMISVPQGSWFKRMPFPIQPTETQSFRRKWYS